MNKTLCKRCLQYTNQPITHIQRGNIVIDGPLCADCWRDISASYESSEFTTRNNDYKRGHKNGHQGGRQYISKGWFCLKDKQYFSGSVSKNGKRDHVIRHRDRIEVIRITIKAAKQAGTYNHTASVRWLSKHGIRLGEVVG
ncbi:hypothetical protein [Prosthecochloris sp.]|uniref:hypothetical protein n=1 Tax=Prosthecochloris sp. TaxID=290513 RepID=UPI0025CCD6A6|nr:hypothetical protein [Prosthecochloris sp.]